MNLLTVVIPNAKVLKDSCFRDCESLREVNISSKTTAERYAFFGCAMLENLALAHGFELNKDYVDPDGIPDPTQGILRYLKFKRSQVDVKEAKYLLILLLKSMGTKVGRKLRVRTNNKVFRFLSGVEKDMDMRDITRIVLGFVGVRP
jgi:hypothetical protein